MKWVKYRIVGTKYGYEIQRKYILFPFWLPETEDRYFQDIEDARLAVWWMKQKGKVEWTDE